MGSGFNENSSSDSESARVVSESEDMDTDEEIEQLAAGAAWFFKTRVCGEKCKKSTIPLKGSVTNKTDKCQKYLGCASRNTACDKSNTCDNIERPKGDMLFTIDVAGNGKNGVCVSTKPTYVLHETEEGKSEYAEDSTKSDKGKDNDKFIFTGSAKSKELELASTLDPGIDCNSDIYFTDPEKLVQIAEKETGNNLKNVVKKFNKIDEVMSKTAIVPGYEQKDCIPSYSEKKRNLLKQRRAEREKTKGKKWFDLPKTELTEEKERDLRILKMRRALDPKHFYKNNDMKGLPKYFQMGHVVDNPIDFYRDRIPKKQRKRTLVDELLADAEFRKYNKRKYAEAMMSRNASGKGARRHMKRMATKKRR